MKKRIKEIEEEAGALREMQSKAEKDMGPGQGLLFLIESLCPASHRPLIVVDRLG